jgi:RNA polymerase-binding transcription factor DksA
MNDKQHVLQRLRDLTHDFESIVGASRDTNADDEHDPEGATIAFERSQIEAFTRQAAHHLQEIDAALARIEASVYGSCELCHRRIGEGRLTARPTARTCIRCAATSRR